DRRLRRLADMQRRVEVGLAGTQPDDVAPRRLQRQRLRGDRDGRRGLDSPDRIRQEGHDRTPAGGLTGGVIGPPRLRGKMRTRSGCGAKCMDDGESAMVDDAAAAGTPDEPHATRLARLRMRSWRRGTREMD